MNSSASLTRCLGTADPECQSCARRTTREQARERAERAGVGYSWWMVPPTARPCAQRIAIEEVMG